MTDEVRELPEEVRREIAKHHEQYRTDPEKAHWWDPGVIGVPGGPVSCLLLFHRGRRSGKRRNSVLQYYERDGEIAVVGSKGGLPAHPIWYQNLVTEPHCEVWIGSHRSSARARVVSGEERDRWWRRITEEQPIQLEYQARTSRQIPVVLLELDSPAPGADETKGGT